MKYSIQKIWLSLVCMIVGTAAWGQDLQLCTSTSDLVAGGIYYIANKPAIEGGTYFMAKYTGGDYFKDTQLSSDKQPCELILGRTNDAWYFSYVDNGKTMYLNPTSTLNNNRLQTSESLTEYGKFSIEFAGNTSVIKSNGKSSRNVIYYYPENHAFSCYNATFPSANPIYLYKQVTEGLSTTTITIASACTDGTKCYSTYSNASAWVVPKDLTVAEIGIENNTLNVKEYAEGDIVPANTGVMVSASAGGDYTVDLTTETGTSVLGDANRLRPSGPSGITADDMDPNCLYYRLTMHNGTQIGFWWGAENGAAFPLAANKAYLAVPQTATSAKMGMWFGSEGDPTAIDAIGSEPSEAAIYNLHGQRISHLQKGVNIVEGKKIIR